MSAASGGGERIGRISVISPMRDEAAHVEAFVADLAAQDFDGELEVLVADGGSVDDSAALLRAAAERAGIAIAVLDNPAGWVSPGLNACIAAAHGDLIVRLDCHSRYPSDYLRRCAELAAQTGAWNVGGRVIADGATPMERAVACAMSSPFGGIGWTRMDASSDPVEVDTVTFGAFRPAAFEQAGGYDEQLVRNQDDELNLRLRAAGGRIVLDPTLEVRYRPRGSLGGVWRQYYGYGLWKVPVMLKHRQVLTARSMAPLGLIGSLALLTAAAPLSATARRLLVAELALYVAGMVGFAFLAARARREPVALVARVAATFPAFHFGYGVGMAVGWLKALRGWLAR
jgi:succinoglycan biosynthesis protein ExoA